MMPPLLMILSLSLGPTNRSLIVLLPLRWTWTPIFTHTFLKHECVKTGVQVHFKGNNTIKDLLVAPKDRDSIINKGGIIYRYKYNQPGCIMEHIGETGRNFGDRYREHLQAPSPIYDHANTTGHTIKLDSFSIVDREYQGITRTLKEAMFIRVNAP